MKLKRSENHTDRYEDSMDKPTESRGSHPTISSTPNDDQNDRHFGQLATFDTIFAMAPERPICCISVTTTITATAVHTIHHILANGHSKEQRSLAHE